jgi:hypothetical protein
LARSTYKEDAQGEKTLHRFEKAVTKIEEIDAVRFSLMCLFCLYLAKERKVKIFFIVFDMLNPLNKSMLKIVHMN